MQPQAVVFDIGNVLIEWQPERFYDARIGPERRKRLFSEVDLHGVNDAVDRGGDFRALVYAAAEANPGWEDEIRHWHDSWSRIAGPEIPASVATLRALRRRGVPVFALSNFGIGPFEVAQEVWPFLTEFDRPYISGHMGMAKPDAEIYAALEADSGVAPGGLLFTDDRAENIAAAEARGWQTHLFDGPEGFAARLVDLGLLAPGDLA
ncbi:HAD family hydrolase [Roseivivax sp.]